MNCIAAGLAATVAFVASASLLSLVETITPNASGWGDFDVLSILEWPIGGLSFAAAAVVFWLTPDWRRKTTARARRKSIAARARA